MKLRPINGGGKFLSVLVLLISLDRYCDALANHAVYTIENLGSKQCLFAGGVVKSGNKSDISLFKKGRANSKPCSDMSSLNTTDFSQQWMVKIQSENAKDMTYQVQLAMLNTLYYDAKLNAEVRGEFIMYFPDPVFLKAQAPVDESTQSQVFLISDPGTKDACLTGSGREIQFVTCDGTQDAQKWVFTLVNEKLVLQNLLMMKASSSPLH